MIWFKLCVHAAYYWWNPITLILNDDWCIQVYRRFGPAYPGWAGSFPSASESEASQKDTTQ